MKRRYDISSHLRRHRRRVDLTQQALADRLGVTRQTILNIERGKYSPTVGLALGLAQELGVSVEELFELEG
jgi:putative transcriptional regulator